MSDTLSSGIWLTCSYQPCLVCLAAITHLLGEDYSFI